MREEPRYAENLRRLRDTLVALGREGEAEALPKVDAITPGEDGEPDGAMPQLAGRWVDSNGGLIEIVQDGVEVVATGQNEKVTKYWSRGVATLSGRSLTMTHYLGEQRTDTQHGRASEDGTRINWANGSHWERKSE